LIAEDVSAAGEWQVAGQDQRGVFVADGDELEEQVRGVLLEGQVANFVDDDQCVAAEFGEFSSKPVSLVSVLETGHPVGGGGEQHALSGVAGGDAEGDRHMGFAGAGRSEKDHVTGLGEVVGGGQRRDVVAADSWLVVEVELVEVLRAGKPAARIRSCAPEALRAATSRSRTAIR
jgi:hypothetical protein